MTTHTQDSAPQGVFSGIGCLVRLLWMLVGNVALAILVLVIWSRKPAFPSLADLAFWLVVGVLIGIRYMDIRLLKGQTGAGAPATMRHWRRYVLVLVILALIAWGAAHGIAYLSRP